MSDLLQLTDQTLKFISGIVPMATVLKQGTFCACCGVSSTLNWSNLHASSFNRFGMLGAMADSGLEKLTNNREWVTIPDEKSHFTINWALADESLHDL